MATLRRVISWQALVLLGVLFLMSSRSTAADNASEARLRKDITYLASDECEGRGVATQGNRRAGEYIAGEFKKAGVKPGGVNGTYFQPFTVAGGTLEGEPTLVLRGPQGQEIALKAGVQFEPLGVSYTGEVKAAPVVFVGYGLTRTRQREGKTEVLYDDYADLDVKGKVVVALQSTPRAGNTFAPFLDLRGRASPAGLIGEKLRNAKQHEAAGLLLVNDVSTAGDDMMVFSMTAVDRSNVDLPAFQLSRSTLEAMLQCNPGGGLLDREQDIARDQKPRSEATGWTASLAIKTRRTIDARNVVGVLDGAGPLANETVVVGAHYDHWGFGGHGSLATMSRPVYGSPSIHHGADDNGSGTTSVIELARRMAAIPNRQGRRLVFILFSGEELGLFGSVHYCNNPIYPLADTVAMVNLDMVGRLNDDKLIVYGHDTATGFDAMLEDFNKKYHFKLRKDRRGSNYWGASDHAPFATKQIPVFFFFTDVHPDYHRPSDTSEKINISGMGRVCDLTQDILVQLTTQKERPEYIKTPPRQGGGQATPPPVPPRLGIEASGTDNSEGVLVTAVTKDGPAAKAGLKEGDRIMALAGQPVRNYSALLVMMRNQKAGEAVELSVIRDGKTITIKVTPEATPQPPPQGGGTPGPRLGIRPNYGDDKGGVLVDAPVEGGAAAKAGIKAGDRIVELGGKPVKDLEGYMELMSTQKAGVALDIVVIRDGKRTTVKVTPD